MCMRLELPFLVVIYFCSEINHRAHRLYETKNVGSCYGRDFLPALKADEQMIVAFIVIPVNNTASSVNTS